MHLTRHTSAENDSLFAIDGSGTVSYAFVKAMYRKVEPFFVLKFSIIN